MTFRTTILQSGKTATGVEVPPDEVSALGSTKKPAVLATINGYSYRTSIGSMGGKFMLPISAEHRTAAGLAAGDEVEVTLELDTAPRVVIVPDDLTAALDADPEAKAFFDKLSYSNKLRHVLAIDGAKAAETRARRIAASVSLFHQGQS